MREKNREKRKVEKKLKSLQWERQKKKKEREKIFEPDDNVSILNFF